MKKLKYFIDPEGKMRLRLGREWTFEVEFYHPVKKIYTTDIVKEWGDDFLKAKQQAIRQAESLCPKGCKVVHIEPIEIE